CFFSIYGKLRYFLDIFWGPGVVFLSGYLFYKYWAFLFFWGLVGFFILCLLISYYCGGFNFFPNWGGF
ncbi:hypothetical protein ABFV55_27665, partial [Pseudomonas syringae]|uniref:hypothetical protein n=1 Tax=Pseudomonas syringae TaxID=317 RepID=UPI0034D9829A